MSVSESYNNVGKVLTINAVGFMNRRNTEHLLHCAATCYGVKVSLFLHCVHFLVR